MRRSSTRRKADPQSNQGGIRLAHDETTTGDERNFELDRKGQRRDTRAVFLSSLVVIIASFVVAGVVLVVSHSLPAKYSSSATVAISVSGSDINDTSLGADNLASQYAQQVNATPVLERAQQILGAGIPSTSVSGGAVGAQNVVAIHVAADSASLAQRRAAAITTAFVAYVNDSVTKQATNYATSAQAQLAPLSVQIRQVQSELNSRSVNSSTTTTDSATAVLEQEVGTLEAERAAALSAIAQTSVAGRPSVVVVDDAGAGGKTAPKPGLYALVGFIVALLVFSRLAVYRLARRQPV